MFQCRGVLLEISWNSNVICFGQTNLLTNALNKDISVFDILDYHARSQGGRIIIICNAIIEIRFWSPLTDI